MKAKLRKHLPYGALLLCAFLPAGGAQSTLERWAVSDAVPERVSLLQNAASKAAASLSATKDSEGGLLQLSVRGKTGGLNSIRLSYSFRSPLEQGHRYSISLLCRAVPAAVIQVRAVNAVAPYESLGELDRTLFDLCPVWTNLKVSFTASGKAPGENARASMAGAFFRPPHRRSRKAPHLQ